MTAPELLAALDGAEVVPLAVLRGLVGWNRQQQRYAVQAGLIRPVSAFGPHGGYQVSRDDAITILAAAALALSAGVAVVSMLRSVQAASISTQALADAAAAQYEPTACEAPPDSALRSLAPLTNCRRTWKSWGPPRASSRCDRERD
jgi:hypothetical protein